MDEKPLIRLVIHLSGSRSHCGRQRKNNSEVTGKSAGLRLPLQAQSTGPRRQRKFRGGAGCVSEPSGCAGRCCLTPWALLSAANLGSIHTPPLSTPPSVSGQSVRAMGAWLCPPRFPKMLPLSAVSGPKTPSCRSCAQARSSCEGGAARDSPHQADAQWYPGD